MLHLAATSDVVREFIREVRPALVSQVRALARPALVSQVRALALNVGIYDGLLPSYE